MVVIIIIIAVDNINYRCNMRLINVEAKLKDNKKVFLLWNGFMVYGANLNDDRHNGG